MRIPTAPTAEPIIIGKREPEWPLLDPALAETAGDEEEEEGRISIDEVPEDEEEGRILIGVVVLVLDNGVLVCEDDCVNVIS